MIDCVEVVRLCWVRRWDFRVLVFGFCGGRWIDFY